MRDSRGHDRTGADTALHWRRASASRALAARDAQTASPSGRPRRKHLAWPGPLRQSDRAGSSRWGRDATAAILACLDLPTRAPPTEAALPEAEPADPSPADW